MVPRHRGTSAQSPGQLGAYKMCRVYIKHLMTVLVYTRYNTYMSVGLAINPNPNPSPNSKFVKKCVRNSAKFRVRLSRLMAHIKIEKPCCYNIYFICIHIHRYSSIVCVCAHYIMHALGSWLIFCRLIHKLPFDEYQLSGYK